MRLLVPSTIYLSLVSIRSVRSLTTKTMTKTSTKNLVVDPFCFRQFQEHEEKSKKYGGTVFSIRMNEFERIVNERYNPKNLVNGYAPFCKHLFVLNDFTGDVARVNVLPVKGNEHLVRSDYAARNEKEVPILQRYIPLKEIGGSEKLPQAKYLDLILYSREQIRKEKESMKGGEPKADDEEEEEEEVAPWGIVSIKAQDEPYELPMNPYVSFLFCIISSLVGSLQNVLIDSRNLILSFFLSFHISHKVLLKCEMLWAKKKEVRVFHWIGMLI